MLTAPLLFAAAGYLVGPGGAGLATIDVDYSTIHVIAEFTLVIVLFTDAARINLGRVRRDHGLPERMLVIGLPLTIIAGTAAAIVVFPGFSIWEAALLAALLAPTDAALGQVVVTARSVPLRIRQAINIESGLNDGIALPAVLLFAALAGASQVAGEADHWARFVAMQITLGPLAGAMLGLAGARLIDAAAGREWATSALLGVAILSLAILAYAVAELIGGNGFIAAFVAGMAFGNRIRHSCDYLFKFMESEGQLLMLLTFLVFGSALLPEAIDHLDAPIVIYALLSLTVLRMLPVALSLLGSGIRLPTVLFLGWFGPRGLASILFVLLIVENLAIANRETIFTATVATVGLSVLLHGMTAGPFAAAYGRAARNMGDSEEHRPVSSLPLRAGRLHNDLPES